MRALISAALFGAAALWLSPASATASEVQIVTDPPGASCTIVQGRGVTRYLARTPGFVRIDRGSGGLEVTCRLEGFEPRRFRIGDPFAGSPHEAFLESRFLGRSRARRIRSQLRRLQTVRLFLLPAY